MKRILYHNCFGYSENGCKAHIMCDDCKSCAFFKTKEQVKKEKSKTAERLLSLPQEQRFAIYKKYNISEITNIKPYAKRHYVREND